MVLTAVSVVRAKETREFMDEHDLILQILSSFSESWDWSWIRSKSVLV